MTDTNKTAMTLEERVLRLEAAARASQAEADDLYARLKKSAETVSALTDHMLKRDNELFALMEKQKTWAEAESDLLRKTRREMLKLSDVYYHVFPERLAEDVRRLEEQEAVNSNGAPDADKKG